MFGVAKDVHVLPATPPNCCKYFSINFINIVTLSWKTSLILEVHKAGFRREGHNFMILYVHCTY